MPGLGTKGKAMVELEDMREVRGRESGQLCVLGTRKGAANSRGKKLTDTEKSRQHVIRGWVMAAFENGAE